MIPVVVLARVVGRRTGRGGGPGRILVHQRQVTLGIRGVQAIQFGQRHRLNNREALGLAGIQILFHLGPVQPVCQFPGGVGQVQER